jgi:hypothetical protein
MNCRQQTKQAPENASMQRTERGLRIAEALSLKNGMWCFFAVLSRRSTVDFKSVR